MYGYFESIGYSLETFRLTQKHRILLTHITKRHHRQAYQLHVYTHTLTDVLTCLRFKTELSALY